jgi:hypothetical protein
MSFASTSNGHALSQHPSHFLSSPGPQQPWYRDHQDILRTNFGDARSDGPRRSVMLPNPDSLLVSHSWVPGFPDQNFDPSSHFFFTPPGSSQPPDLGVSSATQYLSEGPLPRASFATDATAMHRPAYVPPSPWITYPTMPSAGPSRFVGEQPVGPSRNDMFIAPPGQMMAAPAPPPALPPTPLSLSFFNDDPRAIHPFPIAPAAPAQAQDMFNTDMAGWHRIESQVAGGDNTSTYIPPSTRPRPRPPSGAQSPSSASETK